MGRHWNRDVSFNPYIPIQTPKIEISICNHQVDTLFYMWPNVCSGDLPAKKKKKKRVWSHMTQNIFNKTRCHQTTQNLNLDHEARPCFLEWQKIQAATYQPSSSLLLSEDSETYGKINSVSGRLLGFFSLSFILMNFDWYEIIQVLPNVKWNWNLKDFCSFS